MVAAEIFAISAVRQQFRLNSQQSTGRCICGFDWMKLKTLLTRIINAQIQSENSSQINTCYFKLNKDSVSIFRSRDYILILNYLKIRIILSNKQNVQQNLLFSDYS